jgi:beta-glucosidase
MDRCEFLNRSLVGAGSALLAPRTIDAFAPSSRPRVPDAIASMKISKARFPEGFLWGMATVIVKPIALPLRAITR